MKLCPSKRSHIHPNEPPRFCVKTCARYSYAVHLTDLQWIKPEFAMGQCPNHVPMVRADRQSDNAKG